ncbi:MAG: DegV family protein [Chloroflexi bacterium]|nr:DegV family protein [Chloroflexota bacterium]
MANVKIITDSLADIPQTELDRLNISCVPCIVRFGEKEYRDKVDLSTAEFYRLLIASPEPPATSQPATGAFEQVYRELAQSHSEMISIHVIGALSGTLNSARLAAENVKTARIELFDTQQVSMAEGWLVILAARAAQAGAPMDEILAILRDARERVHLIGMLDTLEYAQRGGRLGKGAALVGTLLNVKPLISILRGEIVPVENVRTKKRALERLEEIVLSSGPIQELAVIHAAARSEGWELVQKFSKTLAEEHIILTETGPVLGTHTGPGTVGVAWVTGKY